MPRAMRGIKPTPYQLRHLIWSCTFEPPETTVIFSSVGTITPQSNMTRNVHRVLDPFQTSNYRAETLNGVTFACTKHTHWLVLVIVSLLSKFSHASSAFARYAMFAFLASSINICLLVRWKVSLGAVWSLQSLPWCFSFTGCQQDFPHGLVGGIR